MIAKHIPNRQTRIEVNKIITEKTCECLSPYNNNLILILTFQKIRMGSSLEGVVVHLEITV